MNKAALKTLIILLPILLFGTIFSLINSIHLMIVFSIVFLFLSRDGKTIVSVFILCPLLGVIKEVVGGAVPGTVVAFVLILAIQRNNLFDIIKQINNRVISYIIIIVSFLILFYFFTAETENSAHKIISILLNTIVYTIGLLVIAKSSKNTIQSIAPVFLLYGLILLRLPMDFFGYSTPEGLFDFSFYRESTALNKHAGIPYLSYHFPGMAAVLSISFWLSTKRDSLKWLDYILLITSAWLILLSGARQAIVGFLAVIVCWFSIRSGKLNMKSIVLVSMLLPVIIMLLQLIDAPQIQVLFEDQGSSDKNLNRNYDYPIMIINNNLFTGIGFGNYYNSFADEVYPHNIVLEILCEMGILGLFFFLFVTIFFTQGTKFSITKTLNNECWCMLLWLPYFIRSMISSDLSENIIVFLSYAVYFFSTNNSNNKEKRTIIEEQHDKGIELLQSC